MTSLFTEGKNILLCTCAPISFITNSSGKKRNCSLRLVAWSFIMSVMKNLTIWSSPTTGCEATMVSQRTRAFFRSPMKSLDTATTLAINLAGGKRGTSL